MKVFKLIFKNSVRHRLRTILTILGLALAVMAFGLIRTFIKAWYAGADAASPDRLITRSSVSIVFTLPISYKEQLMKMDGISDVSYANWFGGIYIDPKNFFAQFAVEPETFLKMYPEYIVPADQYQAFLQERKAVIIGRRLADRFGWKIGDPVSLTGTIYPGNWDFVIRGIYTGKEDITDETIFVMRFDYLDEVIRRDMPGRAGQIGWYVLKMDNPARAAEISKAVDAHFKNSLAETLTETEKEFQMSFIQMAGAIIIGLRVISYLIIGVILLVLANTMAMTARERVSEHAFLRTLGFRKYHLFGLILGESLIIAFIGGLIGILLLSIVENVVAVAIKQFFPSFSADLITYFTCMATAFIVGIGASIFPIQRAMRIKIVDGLRVVD
jgi:putative ABC transport system permease protein